ncbi:hypothetical protein M758_8G186000 [Ceratodon purpureus]|nr:hypothetical protein M758_8G186000 [Ceratodon purpureus]
MITLCVLGSFFLFDSCLYHIALCPQFLVVDCSNIEAGFCQCFSFFGTGDV